MIKLLLSSLAVLATTQFYAQNITLLNDLFESGGTTWTASGDLTPNEWIVNSCAGNGPSFSGINSMYISPIGGTIPGCDAGETEEFIYENAPAGLTHSTIISHTVNAGCATTLELSFDYTMGGIAGEDFAEVIYSTDGGATWIPLGPALPITATWSAASNVPLPASLNGTTFEIGFRFTYNDANVAGEPLSIDNVVVAGIDPSPPAIVCDSPRDLPVQSGCLAITEDYTTSGFTLSDNCSDSVNITVVQDIPANTVLGAGPGGSQVITLTATDEAGNSSTCSFTLNIIDTISPTIVCPADTSVYVDNNCDGLLPDYTSFVAKSDNCSSSSNITTVQSPTPGTIINGAIVVTPIIMTSTDEFGNSSTCTFDMRTLDTIPTTIICPADTGLIVDMTCQATVADYTTDAILVDNCEPLSNLTVTQSPLPGTVVSTHQTITLTVTGGTPNTPQSCTFNGWIVDTIAPAIICPSGPNPQYVGNNCTALLADLTAGATVSENCGSVLTVTQSPVPGATVGLNPTLPITLTVSDTSGNTNSCQFFVAVIDTTSPVIVCPSNQQEPANAACSGTLGNYTSLVPASDNCSSPSNIIITQSPAQGTAFSGTQTVTLTAEDEAGNTSNCTFLVSVVDQTPPTITCPPNQTVGTSPSTCNYTLTDFTGLASAFDNCTATSSISFSQSPAAGNILNAGTHTITISATDENGNTSNCTFDLTVTDQTPPVFTVCPPTQSLIVDAACSAVLPNYVPAAAVSDNCTSSGNITLTQSPVSGTTISATTLITLTATDLAGNSSTCTFNVVLDDTTSPVMVCPADQTVAITGSCSYTIPDFSPFVGGSDNCSALADMTVTQNPAAGTTSSGITPVLITLTDEAGNSTNCIANVLPDDTTPPTITCPGTQTANAGTACDFVIPSYITMATVTDNCSGYTISQSPAAGSTVPVGTNIITLTATDAGGNTASCDFELFVTETESPVITCPSDITTCDPVVFFTSPIFSDNCLVSLVQTDGTGYSSGSTFPIGITVLDYQAIDSSGNTAGCNFRVEVLEYPSQAIIQLDTLELCSNSSALLEADPATSGTGEWSVTSGTGNFNNEFANTTGINNIAYGTNVYTWTISTAACGSTSDSIVVIRHEPPFPTSISADSIFTCSNEVVMLQATPATVGTGVWTVTPQATIGNENSNVMFSTLSTTGYYTYTWTVSNGTCPSTSDSVVVYYASEDVNASSSDSLVCLENGLVQLSADPLQNGQSAYWSFIAGGGIIDNIYAPNTSVEITENGTSILIYEVSHPNCPVIRDTVIIAANICEGLNPIIPTVITPNYDGRNDLFEVEFLDILYPDCHVTIVNRWGDVVFESTGYSEPWNGTNNGEPLPLGTYFYRIELNDADGTVFTGDISIIR